MKHVLIFFGKVQTDAQRVGPTQFVFNLADVERIHHVIVFLTGVTPFPDGMGGGVYYCYPTPEGPTSQLLGFIGNNKPSAIFKLAKVSYYVNKQIKTRKICSHKILRVIIQQSQTWISKAFILLGTRKNSTDIHLYQKERLNCNYETIVAMFGSWALSKVASKHC